MYFVCACTSTLVLISEELFDAEISGANDLSASSEKTVTFLLTRNPETSVSVQKNT